MNQGEEPGRIFSDQADRGIEPVGWRKPQRAKIPDNVRRELEGHGDLPVQAALAQMFDVPTSLMFSLRRDHKDHALTWLAEKRAVAEWRERVNRRLVICGLGLAIIGTIASIIAAVTGVIRVWPKK